MSRIQLIRRYISERTGRRFEVEVTVASRALTEGQLAEAAAADADRRAELAGKELGDAFRLLNEFEGVGMEVVHAG